jgi:peptidyl-prolyl cis-trans isomerase C
MRRRHSQKKNSLKIFIAVAIVAALVVIASTYLIGAKSDTIVAQVNNHKIYKSEVEAKLRSVFESQNFGGKSDVAIPDLSSMPKEVIEILAKEVYLERELTKEAVRSSASKSKEVKDKISSAKDRIIRQAYIDSVLKEKVSEEKIRAKYLELSESIKDKKEYSISHIVTKTKEEADKIVKDLGAKKAPKFADMAKKYSIDQDSSEKGGSLGFIVEDNMFKEISDVLTTLKKDQISQPIQTKFGWHIVKFSDVREAQSLPFESVQENIREQLSQEAISEINSKITKDIQVKILLKFKEMKSLEAETPIESSSENKPEETIAAPESSENPSSLEEKESLVEKEDVKEEEKNEEKKSNKDESEKKAKSENKKK